MTNQELWTSVYMESIKKHNHPLVQMDMDRAAESANEALEQYEKRFPLIIKSSGPLTFTPFDKLPEPPSCRVLRECALHSCLDCGSSASRSGFLKLFGKVVCDNPNCKTHKTA